MNQPLHATTQEQESLTSMLVNEHEVKHAIPPGAIAQFKSIKESNSTINEMN